MNKLTFAQLMLEIPLQVCFHLFYILPAAFLCFAAMGRDRLRYSPLRLTVTTIGAVLLYAALYFPLWYFWDVDNQFTLLLFFVLAFLYYRRAAKENTYILLFVFLCAIFYSNLNALLFNILQELLFPVSAFVEEHDLWRPVDLPVMAGCIVLTLPAVTWLIRKKVCPLLEKARGGESLLLWLLPTAFLALLVANISQDLYEWPKGSFYSFLVVLMVLSTLQSAAIMRQSKKSAQREEALHQVDAQLKTQRERFGELLEYNRQVRVLRHDMRHHLLALEGMLTEERYQEAANYLKEYGATVEPAEGAPLCENYVADVIARHYQAKAATLGIRTDFLLSLPQACGVADADLCVVLGNLLENAVNACGAAGEPFIRMRVKVEGEELLIAIDNSCGEKEPAGGAGLGIPSVKAVARTYGGMARLTRKGNVFEASVLLTRKPERSSVT